MASSSTAAAAARQKLACLSPPKQQQQQEHIASLTLAHFFWKCCFFCLFPFRCCCCRDDAVHVHILLKILCPTPPTPFLFPFPLWLQTSARGTLLIFCGRSSGGNVGEHIVEAKREIVLTARRKAHHSITLAYWPLNFVQHSLTSSLTRICPYTLHLGC